MDREEEYEFYKDPERQRPQGPARQRRSKLDQVMPVRLEKETIEAARRAAEAEGRSVGAWIRGAISEKLSHNQALDEAKAESQTTPWAGRSAHGGWAMVLAPQEPIMVVPSEAIAAQLIRSSEDVIATLERTLTRLEERLARSSLETVFTERIPIDSDLIAHRPRSYVPNFTSTVVHELRATESAILRVVQLAESAQRSKSPKTVPDLRARVQRLRAAIDGMERAILDTPKGGLSPDTEQGLIDFYAFADAIRFTLTSLDDELFALATEM
jgi:hypothetical protein